MTIASPTNSSLYKSESTEIISTELREILEQIIYLFILLNSLVGVVTNTINIRVFYSQGLRTDSSNISLFAWAFSDFAGSLFMIPSSLCYLSRLASEVQFITCFNMMWLPPEYVHIVFSRITSWLTVYISIERCLVVLMPLRFHQVVTPKVTASSIAGIYCFYVVFSIPFASTVRIVWHTHPGLNTTLPFLAQSQLGRLFLNVTSFLGGTVLTSAAIIIVAISTAIMIYNLNVSNKARATITQSSEKTCRSTRDREVAKSVTMVMTLYLACMSMHFVPSLAMAVIPGMNFSDANRFLLALFHGWKYFFDTINSSANFFFFIRTSSRYRATFYSIFTSGPSTGS